MQGRELRSRFGGAQPFLAAGSRGSWQRAREFGGTEGAWTLRTSGVTIICAQDTDALLRLLLGSDVALVRRAGALLKAV